MPESTVAPQSATSTMDSAIEGWDPTPGIVSVWAEWDGRAIVWRRYPQTGDLVREDVRFKPWVLLDSLDPLGPPSGHFRYRELDGPGELRFLVSAEDGRRLRALKDLGKERSLVLPPEEQYLVASGRTYFRDLPFDRLHRLQFDLETTGLDAATDRIFMIAVRNPDGSTHVLESGGDADGDEAELIRRLTLAIAAADPDVIENHNLHGFDLPFLARRARRLGVALPLGRIGRGLRQRPARRGIADEQDGARRIRYVAPGRELIDTMDAVMRYGFSTGDLPWRGLKAVARHFGIAARDRVYIPGDRIHDEYRRDPERVRRYATGDVEEVAALAQILGGAAFALAQMACCRRRRRHRYHRSAPRPSLRARRPCPARAWQRRSGSAHRRGAAPLRDRRRASRREGRRGESLSVADAVVSHRTRA
jgi:DNA polymerase I